VVEDARDVTSDELLLDYNIETMSRLIIETTPSCNDGTNVRKCFHCDLGGDDIRLLAFLSIIQQVPSAWLESELKQLILVNKLNALTDGGQSAQTLHQQHFATKRHDLGDA
jgi:hypothetical protein